MMKPIPFPVNLLISVLVTCVGATIGTYIWEAAETTPFFEGAYGGSRRWIWGIFSGLMCVAGIVNAVRLLVIKVEEISL